MQNLSQDRSENRLSREAFLEEAERAFRRVKDEIAQLHGGPPCMYAVDVATITPWTEEKRVKTLEMLQKAVARAEELVQVAQNERTALWERSDANPDDRELPFMIPLKQIREDLEAYQEVLDFVRLKAK
ncbi:hypothetical protein KBC59_02545 [Patescibacteria group bacterium]|nr:hypothetical protein [Patescibacteria group bacterium]